MVIQSRDFPGDKTEWLQRFRQSQPDNLLATVLLGSDLLLKGDTAAAMELLRIGSRQPEYNDFISALTLAKESTLIGLGHDRYQAKLIAGVESPLLGALRIQEGVSKLVEMIESGSDPDEKIELAMLGAAIGNQFSEGEANRSSITRLFGLQMEKRFLAELEPDVQAPGLAQSPAELIAQIAADRDKLREDVDFILDHVDQLSPEQMMHFIDRQRTVGDINATEWLRAQVASGGVAPPD